MMYQSSTLWTLHDSSSTVVFSANPMNSTLFLLGPFTLDQHSPPLVVANRADLTMDILGTGLSDTGTGEAKVRFISSSGTITAATHGPVYVRRAIISGRGTQLTSLQVAVELDTAA